MYSHGFDKHIKPEINKRSSLWETYRSRQKLNRSHLVIESADYLHPVNMLILTMEELFSMLKQWVVICIVHFWQPSCFCKHWTSLQWWPIFSQLLEFIQTKGPNRAIDFWCDSRADWIMFYLYREEYHGMLAMNSPEADLTGSSTPEMCNVCQKKGITTVPAVLYCKDCDKKFCTTHAKVRRY